MVLADHRGACVCFGLLAAFAWDRLRKRNMVSLKDFMNAQKRASEKGVTDSSASGLDRYSPSGAGISNAKFNYENLVADIARPGELELQQKQEPSPAVRSQYQQGSGVDWDAGSPQGQPTVGTPRRQVSRPGLEGSIGEAPQPTVGTPRRRQVSRPGLDGSIAMIGEAPQRQRQGTSGAKGRLLRGEQEAVTSL